LTFVEAKDGTKLHVSVHDYTDPWKKAPTLLLQHGFSRSGRFWFNMIPYLSRFYRVLCPDLRGLGESSAAFDLMTGISVENYLSDLATIADAFGAESFHYAGESLGGILGLALAAQMPDRVRTLSLLAAPLSISAETQHTFALGYPTWQDALRQLGSRGWSDAVNTATRFPPDSDPAMLEWYANESGKSPVEVLIAMSRLAATVDVTPILDQVRAPVLGLYPANGRITAQFEAVLREKVPQVRLIHLPITYHMIWMLKPAICAEHILHFMAQHDETVCRD